MDAPEVDCSSNSPQKEQDNLQVKKVCDGEASDHPKEVRLLADHGKDKEMGLNDEKVRLVEMQFQFLIRKADDFQKHLLIGQDHVRRNRYACVLPTFLHSCQPFFTYLETLARSTVPQSTQVSTHIQSQLLDFSQQLCERLVQLILCYAECDLLSLDETKPHSISYFCIGQCQIDRVRLSIFHYFKPQPYLAQTGTGLHKCVRWNVDRMKKKDQRAGHEEEMVTDTEYYFLCYEDSLKDQAQTSGVKDGQRMWSLGQWVQTQPDPGTESINDWILCEVPQAQYCRLLCFGREKPSIRSATDRLLGILLPQQSTGSHHT